MHAYAISDVHGCFSQLQELLDLVSPAEDDEVYIMGDLIDRGPQSAEALLWAIDDAPSNFHFLLGNHEDMAGCVIERDPVSLTFAGAWDQDPWEYNGGWDTADQLLERTDVDWRKERLVPWLRALVPFAPVSVEGKDIMLVHAGFDPRQWDQKARFVSEGLEDVRAHTATIEVGLGFGEQREQDMIWSREGWYDYEGTLPAPCVFGHTPTTYLTRQASSYRRFSLFDRNTDDAWWSSIPREPGRIWAREDRIDIDCGCAYGGNLCALRLNDFEPFYVPGLS